MSGQLEGARIIIVDDDAILLLDLAAILRGAGAEIVASCRTVDEGLVAAEIGDVSAAVLDVRVDRDSIRPVAQRLGDRGVPFVFYTGQIRNDPTIADWPDHGVVTKPARARTIISAVAEALNGRKSG